jgi:phage tail sheath protein FI
MPEYLTPGVYIEEIEIGAKPIEGVSTSTAAFLGETERGPTYPQLVTSFPEYQRIFGGFFGAEKFMPYAAEGFFANGGQRCVVCRIVRIAQGAAAVASTLTVGSLEITAVGEGVWGDNIAFRIKPSSDGSANQFRVQVHYWRERPAAPVDPLTPESELTDAVKDALRKQAPPQLTEDFDEVTLADASSNSVEKRINNVSNLIRVRKVGTANPAPGNLTFLAGGANGTGDLDLTDYRGRLEPTATEKRSGLAALKEPAFEETAILYSPNASAVQGLPDELMTHCEINKYRFAILDTPKNQAQAATLDPRSGAPAGFRASHYAAFYYPWIKIFDSGGGPQKFVPPGGHVAGIYARTDIERGVFKAPANEIVRGALQLEFEVTDGAQAVLNPRGVNVIRAFPGRGRRVWGARTLSDNTLWKYVSVRRLFIFLEASIFRGTQWVVFEPNNERLWARVKQTITEFLRTQFRAGALLGATEEEAFFVRVDRSTMTDDDINNGRLIVVIGVAPVRPAEFVIFRIAQLTSSATSVEL